VNLTRSTAAPEVARDLAVCVQYLHGPSAAADTQAAVGQAVGSACTVTHSARTQSQPAFTLADAGDWSFLFCEGCSTLQQGTLCLDGYRGGLLDSVVAPRNAYFDQVVQAVIDLAMAQGKLQRPNVVCAGHSMGGAVAELAAGRIKETNRQAAVAYCSFGAPKPAGWPALAAVNQCQAARWFNEDDPVPLCIPTVNDNLAMVVAFGVRENQRFTHFAQPFGGLSISSTARITNATYPEVAAVSTITNLASWLYSLDTTAGIAHSLPEYIARLTNFLRNNAAAGGRPQDTDKTDDSGGFTRGEITDAQRATIKKLKDREREQHEGPLLIPDEFEARVQKLGKIFQVVLNDAPISITARRRTAYSVARKYNAFLGAVLRQGLTDGKALTEALAAFVAKAAKEDGGFNPTLSQSLPE